MDLLRILEHCVKKISNILDDNNNKKENKNWESIDAQ